MPDYLTARHHMVDDQLRTNRIFHPLVLEAMRNIPRECFIRGKGRNLAYRDAHLDLGLGRYLLAPHVFALMIQEADIQNNDVVLDIGCATGYSTAVLAQLAGTVVALDHDPDNIRYAIKTLNTLGIENTIITHGKLIKGVLKNAPYDVIIIEGSLSQVPKTLFQQLANHGRLVTIITERFGDVGKVTLFKRIGENISSRRITEAFVPYLPEFKPKPSFIFEFCVILSLLFGLGVSSLQADTLSEALRYAYQTNPQIQAARAELRAVDERHLQALSQWYPSVQVSGSFSPTWTRNSLVSNTFQRLDQFQAGLNVVQTLYSGGRISSQSQQTKNQRDAQRARLYLTEQSVFLQTTIAYLDVIRDQAIVNLTINNERVLTQNLQATRDRFQVGEITYTNVSQAESRLAGALSERIRAQGNLNISRAVYQRITGKAPENLQPPTLDVLLPPSLVNAQEQARGSNLSLIAARYDSAVARDTIDVIQSNLFPQITLNTGMSHTREHNAPDSHTTSANVTLQLLIPLYTSGIVASQTRSARHTAVQRRYQTSDILRQVEAETIQAWQNLLTTRAIIQSSQAQVTAAALALEGVRQEERVGTRTLLDTLDAEQELLDAQVSLVSAQRNEMVSIVQLLYTLGKLDLQTLQLDDLVPYDPTAHAQKIRSLFWGTSINQP